MLTRSCIECREEKSQQKMKPGRGRRMSRREWERRKRQRRKKIIFIRILALFIVLLFGIGMGFGIHEIYRKAKREPVEPPEILAARFNRQSPIPFPTQS